jgi:hypothetical protein
MAEPKPGQMWLDGICKLCGSEVEETATQRPRDDYQNRCRNPDCPEHRWHYCGDQEELEYYTHKRGQ